MTKYVNITGKMLYIIRRPKNVFVKKVLNGCMMLNIKIQPPFLMLLVFKIIIPKDMLILVIILKELD